MWLARSRTRSRSSGPVSASLYKGMVRFSSRGTSRTSKGVFVGQTRDDTRPSKRQSAPQATRPPTPRRRGWRRGSRLGPSGATPCGARTPPQSKDRVEANRGAGERQCKERCDRDLVRVTRPWPPRGESHSPERLRTRRDTSTLAVCTRCIAKRCRNDAGEDRNKAHRWLNLSTALSKRCSAPQGLWGPHKHTAERATIIWATPMVARSLRLSTKSERGP